jgi:diketogulonate reductase-like aldo/keto reductase
MKSFFAPTIKLVNNVEIPSVGYGTYKEDANQETVNAIANSIKSGYRHIDTASRYGNE